ncbi:MAG TPA: luciferase family protein [Solirubrobacteraceae bacterium]|nr:luciferase family protein [Solirubrobacteraceae bacterium]
MDAPSLTAAVRRELLEYPGVTEGAHRFGGIVFHLGRRELGHLHGETVADLPFPPQVRDELVASGRVSPGHGGCDRWVSRRVNGPQDVEQIVALFRLSYEHAAAAALDDAEEEDQAATADADRERRPMWRGLASVRPVSILRRKRRQ